MSDLQHGEESIADMLRKTAYEVLHASVPEGFEWIEEYQQYYSRETNFYYEPNSQLYYNPSNLTYYRFNEEIYNYEVVECCQPTKWSSNGFRKRAIQSVGEQEFKKFDQDCVDICELLFGLIGKVVKDEHIYNKDPIVNKAKPPEQITAKDINKMMKRRHKRKWTDTETKQQVFDTEKGEFVGTSPPNPKVKNIESDEESDTEVIVGDERAIMMQEENYDQPPCIRIIDKNQKLQIVTISGGYIGSDPECEVVLMNNLLPERCAELLYNEDFGCYSITKIEESCVVQVNSNFLQINQNVDICHRDTVIVSGEALDIHVHMGSNTCPACEPGLCQIEQKDDDIRGQAKHIRGELARRKNLKKMMKSYGITPDSHLDGPIQKTRKIEGPSIENIKRSDGVYGGCLARPIPESERKFDMPQSSSTIVKQKEEKPIDNTNIGFKLLKSMGWTEGKGLGKDKQGKVEPIATEVKNDKQGLGSSKNKPVKSYKEIVLDKTKQRFNEKR